MSFEGARKYTDGGTERAKGKSLGTLKFLTRYLKPFKKDISISAAAILVNSGIVLSIGSALKHLIDSGITEKSQEVLNTSFLFIAGLVLLLGVSSYIRIRLVTTIGENVIAKLRSDLFSHVLKLSPTFFETTRTGEIISRISTDTTLLQSVITSSVSFFMRNCIIAVGGTAMLAITSPRLTGYVLFMIVLVVVPIVVIGRRVRKLSRGTQDRVADLSVQVEESLSHIKIIQAFGTEKMETSRFGNFTSAVLDAALLKNKMRAMLTASVITLIFGAITLILWFGGLQVIKGNISGGELSAFMFYSVVVASAVGALSELFADLQRAAGATERMVELLATKQFVSVKSVNPISFPTKITKGVEFRNVCFSYPTRPDKFALDHVDLLIPAGKTTALVGPSGAGKSTVIQLLLRFYDPSSGTIAIDDEDIALFNLDSLRSHMGLVPQEPFIFSSSALENIRYGKPDASREEVVKAAKAAAAMEFIEKLPEGFDTYLGEKGVRLSGGQKQRIAIARAILRNPKILLLDEATSSLDAENERLVQGALENLMEGRTTIVIAHRLSTVRKADQIVVLNNGIVESVGNHEELADKNSTYANLSRLQFT